MDSTAVLTIIASILVPMLGGFGWILHRLSGIETRLTIVETIMSVAGLPVKPGKGKIE